MNNETRMHVTNAAAMFYDGVISYVTMCRVVEDIAKNMEFDSDHLVEQVETLCEFWENNP